MNTKELRKYCIDNHRKMWHWLAENPNKNKKDWPGWKKYNIDPSPKEMKYCFLCGYISHTEKDKGCYHCPLDWYITDMCMSRYPEESYYLSYCDAITLKAKTKYAKIIANLPEKDDTEELTIKEAMWRC